MPAKPNLKELRIAPRQMVQVADQDLVTMRPLFADKPLPLLVEPALPGLDLAAWARDHRPRLQELLDRHGGILFRGFELAAVERFREVTEALSSELLEYKERSSPRSQVEGNIYTSTDYPASQPIFLHNENSYQQTFPLKIFFYCQIQPGEGGETPIADVRRVYQRLDPALRQRFLDQGWMVMRNFGDGVNLPWSTVFQTSDKAQVEAHCRRSGIQVEWKPGDRLRTRARRPVAARHPRTGEWVWFNHATFFHVSTLTPDVRDALLEEFAEEDLPSNSYYGDGRPIGPAELEQLRAAYQAETVAFPWQRGDVLMLDNMMVAHARAPYRGERRILVGMSEPCSWEQVEAVPKLGTG